MKMLLSETAEKELPVNLLDCAGNHRLLELALEAVQEVAQRNPGFSQQRFGEFTPQLLLTLLTYCYATEIYGSDDLDWELTNDPVVRYLCGRNCPSGAIIRQFRRNYRPWIQQALVQVLDAALRDRNVWQTTESATAAYRWAHRKLELAVMVDTAASD